MFHSGFSGNRGGILNVQHAQNVPIYKNLQTARNPLQGANFPASIDAYGGLLTLFDIGVSKESLRWVNYAP